MTHSLRPALLGIIALTTITSCLGCTVNHYTRNEADAVTLYYKNPGATEVYFVSSIDHYRLHPTQTDGNEFWVVKVQAQSEFLYFYIVDGTVTLPNCPLMVKDDFGSYNCLYLSNFSNM